MFRFFHSRFFYIVLAALLIGGAAYLLFLTLNTSGDTRITTQVEEGRVRQLVAVSGSVKAEDTAELGFPIGGTVATVHVRKGDTVAAGTPLVTLDAISLNADVADARAVLQSAIAQRAELRAGASNSERTISNENLTLKRTALVRSKNDEALKVASALRVLYSDGLTAYSTKPSETAIAPIITGSYACDQAGTYTLNVYSSSLASGYSVRVSGLENGTFPVSTEQDIAFGTCGLRARFSPSSNYHNSTWYIDIPNTNSSNYTTNKNAYDLAVATEKSVVTAAERVVALAEAEAANVIAPARNEALARADATVAQAEARLARAEATFNNATLLAPFAGTVVEIDTAVGESVTTAPVITLVAPDRFELTARVPEIDIGKLQLGQKAEVVFDTAANTTLTGTIDYIAPSATLIDGVAYYETRLVLTESPAWLRSGLNADVDIIVEETSGLRLPKRFVTETGAGSYAVLQSTSDQTIATTTIAVTLIGNDGYVAITGLPPGTTVIAPE